MTTPSNPRDSSVNLKSHQQQARIDEISAHINQLSTRYRADQSYFSKLSTWYNERSWWVRLGLGLATTSTGALIGLLFSPWFLAAPWVSAFTALGLSLISNRVLTQHHEAHAAYKNALLLEITNMEQILKETVDSFQRIEAPMRQVLSSLELKNTEKETDIHAFKETTSTLETQVANAEQSLQALQSNQALLTDRNQALDALIRGTHTLNEALCQNQMELSDINQELSATETLLQESADSLHQSAEDIASSTRALETLDRQMIELERSITSNHATIHAQTNVEPYISTETPEEQAESHTELMARARRTLAQCVKYEPVFEPQESYAKTQSCILNFPQ